MTNKIQEANLAMVFVAFVDRPANRCDFSLCFCSRGFLDHRVLGKTGDGFGKR